LCKVFFKATSHKLAQKVGYSAHFKIGTIKEEQNIVNLLHYRTQLPKNEMFTLCRHKLRLHQVMQ